MITLKDVNVVKSEIGFESIVEHVDAIVTGSFDKNGKYHEYLKDYCYACTILKLFTDYNGEYDFNEVMTMLMDDIEWGLMESNCGDAPEIIACYVEKEIDYLTRPMASADEAMISIKKLIDAIAKKVDSIDTGKIMSFIENLDVEAVNKFSKLLGGE